MNNTCLSCGKPVQSGRRFCDNCTSWGLAPDVILLDGTPLYLKLPSKQSEVSEQLRLYALIMKGEKHA